MSQNHAVTLPELADRIGSDYFTSPWMSIDADHLSRFGYSTYLDPEYTDLTASRNNPLGAELVDGFLLLSMLTAFHFNNSPIAGDGMYGFNYGTDRVRFTSPVFVGQRIRCVATIAAVDPRPDGTYLVTTDNTIEIEGSEKPAMVARWLSLFATRDDATNVGA
jgi:acyl dehydratase